MTIMVSSVVYYIIKVNMSRVKHELAPSEIRAIRERLGLSQVEAGELIGGGPSSFTKYEAGTVKPAASVINLLRLLEANPAAIITLGGGMPRPVNAFGSGPFEVTGDHISVLRERDLPLLLRKLLSSEAQAHSLPADGIQVASNIHAADDGEDGSITWTAGPDRTSFLPSRLNQFQLKAGKIPPATAAKDVLTKKHEVKDMVRSALEAGGNYIMLCAHPYNGKQIDDRKARIRKELRDAGMAIKDEQVDFRDAEQIATWVNSHPPVATWVKEQTHGTIGPFRSWSHWAGRAEHDQSPWVEDPRLPGLRDRLREIVATPRQVLRVVGLSGVGKSRLILEALRATGGEDVAGTSASDLIIYAVETETDYAAINEVVQTLAVTPQSTVVVVDNCGPESHQVLSAMVLHQGSRLSLVTIDNEIPTGTLDGNTLRIEEAPPSVTEGIISHVASGLPYGDRSRLERFSKGFPEVAVRIGKTWNESRPVAYATDDHFVDTFVLGRNPRDPELLRKSAALLAVFGLVDVGPQADGQLSEIASLGRGLSTEDLHATVIQLVDRGVAQQRGRFVTLQPRPVAMKLAERQWKEWHPSTWERVLSGDISPRLKTLAAKQLALLNTTEVSRKVVSHVCRRGGLFDGLGWTTQSACAEVWSALAEVDPEAVADQIERSLGNIEDLSEVSSEARRTLVRTLEKIAFHSHTFDAGARLMLRLAVAENGILAPLPAGDFRRLPWESGAVDKFKKLFPMLLGGTAADSDARLSFLDEATGSGDPAQREIVCEALINGCQMRTFSRVLGPEVQGSSPVLESWRPVTKEEAVNYIEGCVKRLAQFALHDDMAGISARAGLGRALSTLVQEGFIDTVERVVEEVGAAKDYWPEAATSLRTVIAFNTDNTTPELTERVSALLEKLQPKSLEARIRSTVTEMSWGDLESREPDFRLLEQCRVEAVHGLAAELLQQPATLAAFLPQLSRGQQRMAYQFGAAVADLASSPLEWLEPFIEAVVEAPEGERNHDLLSGFITHLATNHPHVVVAGKQRAARSRELASALPQIWGRSSIDASDVQLAIEALRDGMLPPLLLSEWLHSWVIAEVPAREIAPLFDTLLEHSAEGFTAAVDLMHKYAFDSPGKLDGLHPQVLKLAENSTRWQPARDWNLSQYCFEQIMDWTLRKGRQDSGASNTALALAKALANVEDFDGGFLGKPVLSELLSSFPEVAWPLVGQVIVSDQRRASRLTSILGDQYAIERKPNPVILRLPESTLFAWCHAHPDRAPAYAAELVPVLTTQETAASERSLHPVMARLLDEFGDRDDVRQAVESNIRTYGWSGSRTNYYALYKEPIGRLLQHSKPEVSRWAKTVLRQLDDAIVGAKEADEEREALGGI